MSWIQFFHQVTGHRFQKLHLPRHKQKGKMILLNHATCFYSVLPPAGGALIYLDWPQSDYIIMWDKINCHTSSSSLSNKWTLHTDCFELFPFYPLSTPDSQAVYQPQRATNPNFTHKINKRLQVHCKFTRNIQAAIIIPKIMAGSVGGWYLKINVVQKCKNKFNKTVN